MTPPLTAIGKAVLMAREGRRLTSYLDSVGVWTIGYGTTLRGKPVTRGMTITDAECDALFDAMMRPYPATLAREAVAIPPELAAGGRHEQVKALRSVRL